MAARKSSRVNRKYKTKYRVTNWREYERWPSGAVATSPSGSASRRSKLGRHRRTAAAVASRATQTWQS